MRMRSSRERVCRNNAVQFQSCGGSTYCTALGENGCTDIVSRQLRDSNMVRRWSGQFSGRNNVHGEDRSGRPSLVTPELMESVRQHTDISLTTERNLSSFSVIARISSSQFGNELGIDKKKLIQNYGTWLRDAKKSSLRTHRVHELNEQGRKKANAPSDVAPW